MYADVIWDLKINVSERKYLNYQQMMKEVTVLDCENVNLSSLAPLAHIFIDFS